MQYRQCTGGTPSHYLAGSVMCAKHIGLFRRGLSISLIVVHLDMAKSSRHWDIDKWSVSSKGDPCKRLTLLDLSHNPTPTVINNPMLSSLLDLQNSPCSLIYVLFFLCPLFFLIHGPFRFSFLVSNLINKLAGDCQGTFPNSPVIKWLQ